MKVFKRSSACFCSFDWFKPDQTRTNRKGIAMLNTIENNNIVLVDPDEEAEVVAHLLIKMNAFVSIKTAEIATTLDKTTQYRERREGRFPKLVSLTHHGRRKAYRIQDLRNWLENPDDYRSLQSVKKR